jgi:hypothetical protein
VVVLGHIVGIRAVHVGSRFLPQSRSSSQFPVLSDRAPAAIAPGRPSSRPQCYRHAVSSLKKVVSGGPVRATGMCRRPVPACRIQHPSLESRSGDIKSPSSSSAIRHRAPAGEYECQQHQRQADRQRAYQGQPIQQHRIARLPWVNGCYPGDRRRHGVRPVFIPEGEPQFNGIPPASHRLRNRLLRISSVRLSSRQVGCPPI